MPCENDSGKIVPKVHSGSCLTLARNNQRCGGLKKTVAPHMHVPNARQRSHGTVPKR